MKIKRLLGDAQRLASTHYDLTVGQEPIVRDGQNIDGLILEFEKADDKQKPTKKEKEVANVVN